MTIRITPIPGGPLHLSAEQEPFPVLQGHPGGDVRPDKEVFLCRCGESASKPYCDGAHVAAGFDGENRTPEDRLQEYGTPALTVHFNRSICSGAGECVRSLPEVFVSGQKDWIHPDRADVSEVIDTIKRCPSGALTYTLDDRHHLREEQEVTVKISRNGPYYITGPVQMETGRWSTYASDTHFALCRCGRSANLPFCDYSHGEQGWQDGS
jgi:CDGSH-type Zn-finger protein/ferredoxin